MAKGDENWKRGALICALLPRELVMLGLELLSASSWSMNITAKFSVFASRYSTPYASSSNGWSRFRGSLCVPEGLGLGFGTEPIFRGFPKVSSLDCLLILSFG
ncbi:hypothetical protein B0H67DRAFT_572091 [Lasiosphaeris hirsuta]|uniref:Uncharacterized protein n=1 Tax=Lasiosphaeris hirsuta TaxID=260670 RepID=A0AA40E5P5_9PEZI|nr:hypothetical protein B0H67DRAFT_572091 [Lasiosphaeris hirsuta]